MNLSSYFVVVSEHEGEFTVSAADLIGCHGRGATMDEAFANLAEEIPDYIKLYGSPYSGDDFERMEKRRGALRLLGQSVFVSLLTLVLGASLAVALSHFAGERVGVLSMQAAFLATVGAGVHWFRRGRQKVLSDR
jgi:hypothetical protein